MNQAVSFGLLLAGGVLLESALTGKGLGDVLQGHGGTVSTTPVSGTSSLTSNGVAGFGSLLTSAAGYVNPLAGAKITPERIDQGVDFAGTGTISALGDAVITAVFQPGSNSGWPTGGYVEYQLTSGPDKGAYIYNAEGVRPTVTVGQRVSAGQTVATIIPGSPTGVEAGVGSGVGTSSYAQQHGGYSEGELTAAGQWFSSLLEALGGPGGLAEGRTAQGQAPPWPLPVAGTLSSRP